MAVASGD
ncbi:hypothetical protein D018_1799A, partial [Vibrio parahaemolyticus VP2007-007]